MNFEAAGRILIVLALLALCGILLVTGTGDVELRVPMWLVAITSAAAGNGARLQFTARRPGGP